MQTTTNSEATKPEQKPAKKQLTIHVSPTALAEIEKLSAKRLAEGKAAPLGLRVGIRGGGCTGFGYLFEWCDDAPRATDRVFEFDSPSGGPKVKVFCDPKSLLYLDGTTLDFVTTMMGHGFKFVNPNVKGACGCGESVQFYRPRAVGDDHERDLLRRAWGGTALPPRRR